MNRTVPANPFLSLGLTTEMIGARFGVSDNLSNGIDVHRLPFAHTLLMRRPLRRLHRSSTQGYPAPSRDHFHNMSSRKIVTCPNRELSILQNPFVAGGPFVKGFGILGRVLRRLRRIALDSLPE